jgi:hypothetical protein
MIAAGGESSAQSQSFTRTLSAQDLETDEENQALSQDVSGALMACRDAVLKFQPGTYSGVRLTFDVRRRAFNCPARIVLEKAQAGEVLFEGRQAPRFLTLLTRGPSFPGTVRNIEIRNYLNGIGVISDGKVNQQATGVSNDDAGLMIDNVIFRDIGAQSATRKGEATGWGAITLIFTHNNVIKNNQFYSLGNAADSFLIHAVYLYGSRNNRIEKNIFGAMVGAVLKFRDGANQNIVDGNIFRFEGMPLMQEWFCNTDVRGAKNCPVRECPSDNISFKNNQIVRARAPDDTRRGGGPRPVTNPFVSYEELNGFRIAERYYVGRPVPKGCGNSGAGQPLVDGKGGNRIVDDN